MMDEKVIEAGMRIRREVLSAEFVDAAPKNVSEFMAPFREYASESIWGKIWAREGLDLRTRRFVTIALLAALGYEEELEMHVRGGLRAGISSAEIAEVLLHTGAYAGISRAFTAFARAQAVIDEEDGR